MLKNGWKPFGQGAVELKNGWKPFGQLASLQAVCYSSGEDDLTVQQVAQLTALLNTYKAASRRHGVAPLKYIVTAMEDAAQDVKKVDKISFSGPLITSAELKAVLDCISGYPAVKNLCMWSCNMADEGMHALSQFIKASATDRWWRGSKLKMIELISDGADFPPDRWQERYMAILRGALVTQGPGLEMPSLLMNDVDLVTPDTLRLQGIDNDNLAVASSTSSTRTGTMSSTLSGGTTNVGSGKEWEEELQRKFSALMCATAGHSALTSNEMEMKSHQRNQTESSSRTNLGLDPYGVAKFGALPVPPPSGFGTGGFNSKPKIPLAPVSTALAPEPKMAFSPHVLRELSLSMSAAGVGIQILALDHNHLGDLGVQILCLGLKRCAALTNLSLENCGIGPIGATALGNLLTPDSVADEAARQPKMAHLNVSRNNLGSSGVVGLCEGVALCSSLKVLNFSNTGLTEDHIPGLQAFCDALATNPSIEQIDLSANFIGDAGLSVFIPWLAAAKHVRKFRITSRGISRAVGEAFGEAIRGHFPKKKAVKKRAKKK
eukprot:gene22864-30037_t